MQTKAYFASSVPAALEVARQELGENAMLVGSRLAPPQARHYGRLEVTFAWDPKEPPRTRREPVAAPKNPPARHASEMDQILQELSALRAAVGRGGQPFSSSGEPTEDSGLTGQLVCRGFSHATAAEIANGAAGRNGSLDHAVVQEIASRIPVAPFVDIKSGENRTMAFVGPPGRGKTTSLIKIAVNQGLARRVPVRIYSAGAHCIGAQEQMARFAAILGTPFHACESLPTLSLTLNGDGWKGLVLIDTPGISPADQNELGELRTFLLSRPEIESHLVLRADASSADMFHMMSRFSSVKPSRLLFTGTDEAVRVASMVEALIGGGMPATFVGSGQQIPEDIEEVNAETLARQIWSAGETPAAGPAVPAAPAIRVRAARAGG